MDPRDASNRAPPAAVADHELVRAAQAGDRSAFDQLVERYQEKTYGLVYRILGDRERAAETTQDVFVKAYLAIEKFRGEAAFTTWIHRIALNEARSGLRQRRNPGPRAVHLYARRDDEDTRTEEIPDGRYEPSRMVDRKETRELIQAVLGTLDAEDRELIVLRDVQGLPYDEIARITERPLGTVKSTLHRARLKFVERYRRVESGARVVDRGVPG